MTGYVYHLIHASTPHRYIAQLFVTDIPAGTSVDQLQEKLDARYYFGEFGYRWANHGIGFGLKDAPADIKAAWRNGEVQTVCWKSLTDGDLPAGRFAKRPVEAMTFLDWLQEILDRMEKNL